MSAVGSEPAPHAIDASSPLLLLTPRAIVAISALIIAFGAAARLLPPDVAAGWVIRVVAASVLIAVAPGVLATLAWLPQRSFSALELVGIGIGVSFALVQLITIAALVAHWPVDVSLAAIAAWAVAHAVVLVRRRDKSVRVLVSRGELALSLCAVALATLLYAVGSPFDSAEDRIHVSIVQRLVHLSSPAIDNVYLAPNIVYTYPFPATHYLMALMARVEGIDALFLYHKLRAFWVVAALIFLYGCAAAIFESRRIALVTALVVIGFVANGTFAGVPGFYWGQMAPYSHAADVAMGVLLPALLFLAFKYLKAFDRREESFFLVATVAMAFALVVVHPREIIQFLVYLSMLALVLAAGRGNRQMILRAGHLVVATLVLLVAYRLWYASAVATIETLVSGNRADLVEIFRRSSWRELAGDSLPLLSTYVRTWEATFMGWNPIVLLASPIAIYALRRRPLVALLAGSIVCYLLIVRFAALAMPYIYLTYFEILYTPARNFVFFVYLLAGACVHIVAAYLARHRDLMAVPAALVAMSVTAVAFHVGGPLMLERRDLLVVPALVLYGVVAWRLWVTRHLPPSSDAWVDASGRRWAFLVATFFLPLVVLTYRAESPVLQFASSTSSPTPAALIAGLPCLDGSQFCPPPGNLIQFARTEIPADGLLAVDARDPYQSSLFMPQQMVVWSGTPEGVTTVPGYLAHYERTMAAHHEQPFFNDRETSEERRSFVNDLRITHVVVNPRLHEVMTNVLAQDADLFARRYDDGRWAVYEVVGADRAGRIR